MSGSSPSDEIIMKYQDQVQHICAYSDSAALQLDTAILTILIMLDGFAFYKGIYYLWNLNQELSDLLL